MLDAVSKMSDEEFVDFCYQSILLRKADEEGKKHYAEELSSAAISRQDLMLVLLTCEERRSLTNHREFVPSGHFYSTHPSSEDIAKYKTYEDMLAVEMNDEFQRRMLRELQPFHDQCPFPETRDSRFRYFFLNNSYIHSDAIFLYSMIRHFKPRKIIEVGSGLSSCVMMDTNEIHFNGEINIKLIDPFPHAVKSLLKPGDILEDMLHQEKLQDFDIGAIQALEAHDILFIDSTHVSKLNSDVNHIFFKILPSLKPGVIIHLHDIFWPFEYIDAWLQEGRYWNEAYILRAFLQYNEHFEIVLFADYMQKKHRAWFERNMPRCLKSIGGSIWLRKTK
jgi:predicted O-methyltransferase YrrM